MPTRDLPVFVSSGDDHLFGMLTEPEGEPRDAAVLLVWGGVHPEFGRNRMRRRLAHDLAAEGFHVLRIDFRGIGDSTGDYTRHRLDRPALADVRSAVAWLHEQGIARIVLIGTCFGARTALASSVQVEDLAGVALLSSPVKEEGHSEVIAGRSSMLWVLKRAARKSPLSILRDREMRSRSVRLLRSKLRRLARSAHLPVGSRRPPELASAAFLTPFEALIRRHVPVMLLYGKGDDFYPDFTQARSGELGRLLEQGGPTVRLEVVDERLHGFPSVAVQDKATGLLRQWLLDAVPRPSGVVASRPEKV